MPARPMIRLARDEAGATAIEYGLIAALIVITMLGGLALLADKTIETWNDVASNVSAASS